MNRNTINLVGASIATFIAGFALGSMYARKQTRAELEAEMLDRLRAATDEIKKFYKTEAYSTPESTAAALHPMNEDELRIFKDAITAVTTYGADAYNGIGKPLPADSKPAEIDEIYEASDEPVQVPYDVSTDGYNVEGVHTGFETFIPMVPQAATPPAEEVVVPKPNYHPEIKRNVFLESEANTMARHRSEGKTYAEEVATRNRHKPYVISAEEFFSGESGYESVSYTYYLKDGVLADDKDVSLTEREAEDIAYVSENSKRFGDFSGGEPFVVYLRNERLQLDIEMLRSEGSYSEEVLGITETQSSNTG